MLDSQFESRDYGDEILGNRGVYGFGGGRKLSGARKAEGAVLKKKSMAPSFWGGISEYDLVTIYSYSAL